MGAKELAGEILTNLTEKNKEYGSFQFSTLLDIIKGCDEKTRNAFFPNAGLLSGYDDFKEFSARIICCALSGIVDYGFNNSVKILDYKNDVAAFLKKCSSKWQLIFKSFISGKIISSVDGDTAAAFFNLVTSKEYITVTLIRMIADDRTLAKLVFSFVKIYCAAKFEDFCRIWGGKIGETTVEQLKEEDYFSVYYTDARLVSHLRPEIKDAVTKKTDFKTHQTTGRSIASGSINFPTVDYEIITHNEYNVGKSVVEWLESAGRQHGLRSGSAIKYQMDDQTSNWHRSEPFGCVSGDTKITMADRSEKKIVEIKEGDLILSENGTVSETSDEFTVNNNLGILYAINEMPPFMSFEHAVMTEQGWKSLAPHESNRINPHFNVTMLQVGDTVITLDGKIKVERIPVATAQEGERLTGYDLHFREGRNSYYANGLLVLLNYPELTLSRITKNMRTATGEEHRRFINIIGENHDLFEKVFGRDILKIFKEKTYAEFKNSFDPKT